MTQYRRSIFIINRKFQFRFAFYVCSWMVALSFVYPLIVHNLFDYFIRYLARDPNAPPVQTLYDLRDQIMVLLVALQLVFLFVTFLISIFMSHRIAGPLYKLSRFFAMAREGDFKQELFFREKDHFQELAQDYNSLIKSFNERLEGAASEVEQALGDASQASKPKLESALARLRGLRR